MESITENDFLSILKKDISTITFFDFVLCFLGIVFVLMASFGSCSVGVYR